MSDAPEEIDPELDEIVAAVAAQDREGAIRLAAKAFEDGLDHPLVLLLAAEGMEADGRGPEAVLLLRRIVADAPGEAEGWRRLGGALAGQGQPAEAMQVLEHALGLDPDVYWTLLMAGAVAMRLDDLASAQIHYRQAARLQPDQAQPPAALAAIAGRQGDLVTARAMAERAVAIQPALRAQLAAYLGGTAAKSWGFGFKVQ
jgi:tetratricopeptide (TPR) repeat protein